MSVALVTGGTDVPVVTNELRRQGFEVIVMDDGQLAESTVRWRPIDRYVQLPPAARDPWGGAALMATQLATRIEVLGVVAPYLAPTAELVLVTDGWERPWRDALQACAEAVVVDHGLGGARVGVVGDVTSAATASAPVASSLLAEVAPDATQDEWRREIMSLTTGATATSPSYFCWLGSDGRPKAAILRGPVLSPLRLVGADAGPVPGGTDAAIVVARSILAEELGDDARCAACRGTGCAECDGSGLATSAAGLAKVFAEEVVGAAGLTPQGFELPASRAGRWIAQQQISLPAEDVVRRS